MVINNIKVLAALFLPLTTIFEEWGQNFKDYWTNMDYVGFWGWVLLALGFLSFFLLLFFTEYKRTERDSVKFTAITVIISSIFFGFGLHMVLISRGLW
ncbi:MAG: hypothetical protein ACTSVZ_13295 [Promethearchaeota archaeon]